MKSKSKAKPAPKKKAVTALAVRPKARVIIEDPKGLMTPQSPVGQLGELATVGALGLAEIKLTAEEEKVLSEPVNPSDVMMKPRKKDGPPEIPYLPHIVYTRWMNRAFGRTGWAIVPTARPMKQGNLVMVPYLLYIHGVPVAAATGEQEYFETNLQQTYGDVIESTVASALRRCAKRLGIGLEMWDKRWLTANITTPKGSRREPVQREEFVDAESSQSWPDNTVTERENAGRPTLDTTKITNEQRKRLTDIVARVGRPAAEVTLWLKKSYGIGGTKDITRSDYAAICKAVEAPGPLPFPDQR